jgi:hypothetical protein
MEAVADGEGEEGGEYDLCGRFDPERFVFVVFLKIHLYW